MSFLIPGAGLKVGLLTHSLCGNAENINGILSTFIAELYHVYEDKIEIRAVSQRRPYEDSTGRPQQQTSRFNIYYVVFQDYDQELEKMRDHFLVFKVGDKSWANQVRISLVETHSGVDPTVFEEKLVS